MTAKQPIMRKWNAWFSKISDDVATLHFYRKIYNDVGAIVKSNPAISRPNVFYAFLAQGYVTPALVIMRRQVTDNKDSVSLARLLTDISKHPTEVSRTHFHSLYAASDYTDGEIDRDFETAGVESGRDFIDPASVLRDLATLQGMTHLVHKYTDKMVAHIDAHGWAMRIPTFDDLDVAIDTLAQFCDKYSVLLRGEGIAFSELAIEPDWQDVFTVPWIAKPSRGQIRRMTHVS